MADPVSEFRFASLEQRLLIPIKTIAVTKVVLACFAFAIVLASGRLTGQRWIFFMEFAAFSISGIWLCLGDRGSGRAIDLGFFYLLIGNTFGDDLLRSASLAYVALSPLFRLIFQIKTQAFLPYFFVRFAKAFPPNETLSHRSALRHLRWITGLVSLLFFAANFAPIFASPDDYRFLHWMMVDSPIAGRSTYFWTITMVMLLPTAFIAVKKIRNARATQRSRIRFFLTSVLIGITPIVAIVVLQRMVPALNAIIIRPTPNRIAGALIYVGLLSIPATTAYAVLAYRVFELRVIVHMALRHALVRYSVALISAAPFLFVLIHTYGYRDQPLTTLLSGWSGVVLVGLTLTGVLIHYLRHTMMNFIDSQFFRDEYDADRILTKLSEQIRNASNLDDLMALLKTEIDRALHVESVHVCILDSDKAEFRPLDTWLNPLRADSLLVHLAEMNKFLDIEFDRLDSIFRMLSPEDQQWVADSRCRVLFPVVGADQNTLAVIAIGDKRSELLFTPQDLTLLSTIALSCAPVMELFLAKSSTAAVQAPARAERSGMAVRCDKCRSILPAKTSTCTRCGTSTREINIPQVMFGKFKVEQEVGAGGMGVVYRARDISLGRTVAIKTLPKLSPEFAIRLRKEARAAAAVSHPNLAQIYSVDSWKGTPILVLEFLGGGVLSDKIKFSRLSIDETLRVGVALCDAVDCIHHAGILHRDIKPSNIGFTHDGIPKLLDFGLAKLFPEREGAGRIISGGGHDNTTAPAFELGTSDSEFAFAGTPAYLSPEVAQGHQPDFYADLWGLGMTLFECIAGINPMLDVDINKTLANVRRGNLPDIRSLRPDTSPGISEFFENCLAKEQRRRPASAKTMKLKLQTLSSFV